MNIKEVKDFLNTIIPSNDILVKSNVQLYDGHKTYDIVSMNYAHAISNEVESEVLYLTVTREHDKSKEEWKYPIRDELPIDDGKCIVTLESISNKGRFISTAYYSKDLGWSGYESASYRIVAWMPSPDIAKEEI